MGCFNSKPATKEEESTGHGKRTGNGKASKSPRKPVWQSNGMRREELAAKRAEFWDTQPSYGGSQDIWSAIKVACEQPDMESTKLFLDAADVKIAKSDLTQFYDSKGFLYEVPQWAVSDPADWQ